MRDLSNSETKHCFLIKIGRTKLNIGSTTSSHNWTCVLQAYFGNSGLTCVCVCVFAFVCVCRLRNLPIAEPGPLPIAERGTMVAAFASLSVVRWCRALTAFPALFGGFPREAFRSFGGCHGIQAHDSSRVLGLHGAVEGPGKVRDPSSSRCKAGSDSGPGYVLCYRAPTPLQFRNLPIVKPSNCRGAFQLRSLRITEPYIAEPPNRDTLPL